MQELVPGGYLWEESVSSVFFLYHKIGWHEVLGLQPEWETEGQQSKGHSSLYNCLLSEPGGQRQNHPKRMMQWPMSCITYWIDTRHILEPTWGVLKKLGNINNANTASLSPSKMGSVPSPPSSISDRLKDRWKYESISSVPHCLALSLGVS